MKTNSEIRQDAKVAMSGNWGDGIVFTIVYGVISGCAGALQAIVPAASLIFVVLPLGFGVILAYLRFTREGALNIKNMFDVFSSTYYWKSIAVGLLTGIYTLLWSLLLIVPGIIKAMSYALAQYVMADNPSLSAEQAICQSMKMMEGHKMDLFLMVLGYVALAFLSAFLLCIPMLWLTPYYSTVFAKFYEEVKAEHAM